MRTSWIALARRRPAFSMIGSPVIHIASKTSIAINYRVRNSFSRYSRLARAPAVISVSVMPPQHSTRTGPENPAAFNFSKTSANGTFPSPNGNITFPLGPEQSLGGVDKCPPPWCGGMALKQLFGRCCPSYLTKATRSLSHGNARVRQQRELPRSVDRDGRSNGFHKDACSSGADAVYWVITSKIATPTILCPN